MHIGINFNAEYIMHTQQYYITQLKVHCVLILLTLIRVEDILLDLNTS